MQMYEKLFWAVFDIKKKESRGFVQIAPMYLQVI